MLNISRCTYIFPYSSYRHFLLPLQFYPFILNYAELNVRSASFRSDRNFIGQALFILQRGISIKHCNTLITFYPFKGSKWVKSESAVTRGGQHPLRKYKKLWNLVELHLKPCWRSRLQPWKVSVYVPANYTHSRYQQLFLHLFTGSLSGSFTSCGTACFFMCCLLQDWKRSYQLRRSFHHLTRTMWLRVTLKYQWSVQKYSNC